PRSATFHGRDVFAPVAAALATGTAPTALGPELTAMERLTIPQVQTDERSVRGRVIYIDHFGNLTTNVSAEHLGRFRERPPSISIRGVRLSGVASTYSAVPVGKPVAVVNSWGFMEIAVRDGSAREFLQAREGEPVLVDAGP